MKAQAFFVIFVTLILSTSCFCSAAFSGSRRSGHNHLKSTRSAHSKKSNVDVNGPKEFNRYVTAIQAASVPSKSVIASETTGSDIAPSILNLAKTILGAGVLSLPSGIALFSDSKQALVPATILLGVMGVASAYSFSSIGKACQLHKVTTFSDAFAKSFNLTSGAAMSSIITFKTFFACLAYSIVIGDSFSQILQSFKVPLIYSQRSNVIMGMTSLIIFPLCLLRNLDALKYTSMLGLGGVLYCALFMILRYFDGSYKVGGTFYTLLDKSLRPSFNKKVGGLMTNPEIFRLIGMISSSYVAHYNAPKFWKELKNPTRPRYNLVVGSAFLISFVAYVAVILAGFLTFGGNAQGFILNNYASTDSLATIARIAIGMGILFGYPLTFTALRDGVFELLKLSPEARNKQYVPVTIGLLSILTISALILKNVGFVVSFGGALIGAMLIFTIPALMNIRNIKRFASSTAKTVNNHKGIVVKTAAKSPVTVGLAINYTMATMGVVIAVIGVYMNLQSLSAGSGSSSGH